MEMSHLRYFIAAATHLNFSEAAKALYISPSAVSKKITELENELGIQLFDRNKRMVALTSAGSEFLKGAVEMMDTLHATIEKTYSAVSGTIGKLTIGCSPPKIESIPPIIKGFRQEQPHVHITLCSLHNIEPLVKSLFTGESDIAFVVSSEIEDNPDYERQAFYSGSSPLAVVLPAAHPLAAYEQVDVTSLAEEPFVIIDREASKPGYDITMKICQVSGFSPRIVSKANHWESAIQLVASGMGVAFCPAHLILTPPTRLNS